MTVINDEWELTENGLKGRGGLSYYEIPAARLTEDANAPNSGELYDWPVQMAQKTPFSYGAFVEAYTLALKHYAGRYDPPVNDDKLRASIDEGYKWEARKG